MLGSEDNRGIIPRAIDQIFNTSRQLATQGWAFNMQVGGGRDAGGARESAWLGRQGVGTGRRRSPQKAPLPW